MNADDFFVGALWSLAIIWAIFGFVVICGGLSNVVDNEEPIIKVIYDGGVTTIYTSNQNGGLLSSNSIRVYENGNFIQTLPNKNDPHIKDYPFNYGQVTIIHRKVENISFGKMKFIDENELKLVPIPYEDVQNQKLSQSKGEEELIMLSEKEVYDLINEIKRKRSVGLMI